MNVYRISSSGGTAVWAVYGDVLPPPTGRCWPHPDAPRRYRTFNRRMWPISEEEYLRTHWLAKRPDDVRGTVLDPTAAP